MVAFAAALFAVCVIMGAGYFAGRVKLIGSEGLSALGVFLGRFSLPALLFTELSSLSLGDIKLSVLFSVLVGKVAMFIGVLSFSLTFDFRGKAKSSLKKLVGISALRAVFCTQSNDFALGLPIISALFKSSHPHLISMLYILSPISLLLLNPLAFILMAQVTEKKNNSQTQEEKEDPASSENTNQDIIQSTTTVVFSSSLMRRRRRENCLEKSKNKPNPHPLNSAIGRVARTPIVACSLAGLIWNIALGRNSVPGSIQFALETLGDGFTPVALFFTGLSLVGKVAKLTPGRLLLPMTLAISKSVLLATILYLGVGLAGGDASDRGFAFVYGAIPTAPSVLVYAHEYFAISEPKVLDQTAIALVLGTLMATPILFVAGVLIKDSDDSVATKARIAALYLCVPSAVLSSWLVATFVASWRAERQQLLDTKSWRLADSRVLLLLVLAIAHALGSANGATCYASSSRQGHHSLALLRFALSNFCRLVPCGVTAAAALLLTAAPTKIANPTTNNTTRSARTSIFCMRTLSCRPACLSSSPNHRSSNDNNSPSRREPLLPPPPHNNTRTTGRRRASSLSEIFIDPRTHEEEEEEEDLCKDTTNLPPTINETPCQNNDQNLAWSLVWCVGIPIVLTILLPAINHARSNVRRDDACGYVYGTPQLSITAIYLALCLFFSLLGLKRARRLVDTRYEILRSASAGSLHRLAISSPPGSPGGNLGTTGDALPGGADTVGSGDALALFAAQVARENRRARHRGESWTPPTDAQLANARDTTRLAAGLGHRMLILIIIHLIFAFVTCCACIAHLAPRSAKTTTARVLMFAEDTMAASLGIACFFIFGLARNQVLWQYLSSFRRHFYGDNWTIRVGSLHLRGPTSPRFLRRRETDSYNAQNSTNSIDSTFGGPSSSIDEREDSAPENINNVSTIVSNHRQLAAATNNNFTSGGGVPLGPSSPVNAYRLLSVDVNEI